MNSFPMVATCARLQGMGLVQPAYRYPDWQEYFDEVTATIAKGALERLLREVGRSGG